MCVRVSHTQSQAIFPRAGGAVAEVCVWPAHQAGVPQMCEGAVAEEREWHADSLTGEWAPEAAESGPFQEASWRYWDSEDNPKVRGAIETCDFLAIKIHFVSWECEGEWEIKVSECRRITV